MVIKTFSHESPWVINHSCHISIIIFISQKWPYLRLVTMDIQRSVDYVYKLRWHSEVKSRNLPWPSYWLSAIWQCHWHEIFVMKMRRNPVYSLFVETWHLEDKEAETHPNDYSKECTPTFTAWLIKRLKCFIKPVKALVLMNN